VTRREKQFLYGRLLPWKRKGNKKMYRRVTIMDILYTQACKWKNGTDETFRNVGRVSKMG
jgi:hypothetical protein